MRQLHIFERESEAQTLADAMYSEGIEASVKPTRDERFALWVHDDDDLENAGEILRVYRLDPDDRRFRERAIEARAQKKAEARESAKVDKASRKMKREFESRRRGGAGNVTKFLIIACVGFALMASLIDPRSHGREVIRYLAFFDIAAPTHAFAEILSGQVWRLVTPIFIYPGLPGFRAVLSLFFDMWWLHTLASPVESVFRGRFLLVFVLGAAVTTGLAEALFGSPFFGGMSGVVAALFAYLYVLERVDITSPVHLPPGLAFWMALWMVFSLASGTEIALHLSGFAFGAAVAYVQGNLRMRR